MKWYLVDEEGSVFYGGTEEEMFKIFFGQHCDDEGGLYGPIREASQNEGGGYFLHQEGIRGPGMTIEVE